jgi:hypothetical protein
VAQQEYLRRHPEIFDGPDAALDGSIAGLLALPSLAERLSGVERLEKTSAASFYTRLRDSLGVAEIGIDDLMPNVPALVRHYVPGHDPAAPFDAQLAIAPLFRRADLLDVLRRAVVMPLPLEDRLHARFADAPAEDREALLEALEKEAASPVARAHVAILAFDSGTDADRKRAFRLTEELIAPRVQPLVLFDRVLLWVYWKLSYTKELEASVRLLLAWAHASRLLGLFMATDIDSEQLDFMFLAQGRTFPDDLWMRTDASVDVLHPLQSNGMRILCAAAAHVVGEVSASEDAAEVARRLKSLIFGQGETVPAALLRDLTFATNVTGSFIRIDLAQALRSADPGRAEKLSHDSLMKKLTDAVAQINAGDATRDAWQTLLAIVGELRPPADVHAALAAAVQGESADRIAVSDVAINAVEALAQVQSHFDDEYRTALEELAVSAVEAWQKESASRDAAEVRKEADRWTAIAVAIAARIESREATGTALARLTQRFIDAAPAVAPAMRALLTTLPFELGTEYLPPLWPVVLRARAAAL